MAKGKRIAIFLPSFRGGGAERVLVEFANWASSNDIEVDLLVVNEIGPYRSEVSTTVNIVSFNAKRSLLAIPKYISYLRLKKPSGVLSTIGQLNIINSLITRKISPNTRVVLREANTPSQQIIKKNIKFRLIQNLYKKAYKSADYIIAVSRGVLEDVSQRYDINNNILMIPNPSLVDQIKNKAAETIDLSKFGVDQSEQFIVAVGRLTYQKDFNTLIKAFNIIAKVNHKIKLLILGEGELRLNLEREIKSYNLENRVYLPGFVENPFAVMANARALVMSSLYEGMPNVILQAMALNLPIVSTDCKSGPNELLNNSLLEKLVKVKSPDEMAEAVLNILAIDDRPNYQDRLINFSPDIIFRKYLETL